MRSAGVLSAAGACVGSSRPEHICTREKKALGFLVRPGCGVSVGDSTFGLRGCCRKRRWVTGLRCRGIAVVGFLGQGFGLTAARWKAVVPCGPGVVFPRNAWVVAGLWSLRVRGESDTWSVNG